MSENMMRDHHCGTVVQLLLGMIGFCIRLPCLHLGFTVLLILLPDNVGDDPMIWILFMMGIYFPIYY